MFQNIYKKKIISNKIIFGLEYGTRSYFHYSASASIYFSFFYSLLSSNRTTFSLVLPRRSLVHTIRSRYNSLLFIKYQSCIIRLSKYRVRRRVYNCVISSRRFFLLQKTWHSIEINNNHVMGQYRLPLISTAQYD